MKIAGVSAVIVTRGNVDLTEIQESLPFDEIIVWENRGSGAQGAHPDLSVYGRYAGIEYANHDIIYVQDDDCLLPAASVEELLDAYEPGKLVANMPEPFRAHYTDSCLVGFGATFDRRLPFAAFVRFARHHRAVVMSPIFDRECDAVFTTLTERVLVDVPYKNFDYAYGDDRMYRQPEHVADRLRMLDLARQVRDSL